MAGGWTRLDIGGVMRRLERGTGRSPKVRSSEAAATSTPAIARHGLLVSLSVATAWPRRPRQPIQRDRERQRARRNVRCPKGQGWLSPVAPGARQLQHASLLPIVDSRRRGPSVQTSMLAHDKDELTRRLVARQLFAQGGGVVRSNLEKL